MTIGQIAAIIAAIAFAVLVVFLSLSLIKVSGVLTELKETVNRLNTTIDIVTKDVDNLSIEVEGLLNKSNSLVDDINGKLGKTDPLFTAIGDLGVSVSELNDTTKNMATNLVSGVSSQRKSKSPLSKFVRATQALKSKSKKRSHKKDLNNKVDKVYEEESELLPSEDLADLYLEPTVETTNNNPNMSNLSNFTDHRPSTTAGEITISTKEHDE